jgi:hypothetical protein
MWLIGMAASLTIFGVVYFTVVKPSSDTANQAVKTGLQQTQQALNQAQKQVDSSGAASQGAQQTLSSASKLTACVSAAGTDPTKLQACQVKFSH